MFNWSYSHSVELVASRKGKSFSYGTVIYMPPDPVIDFGVSPYPPIFSKNVVSPRVLLVSTWVDARFGFVGGKGDRDETPIMTMKREFLEEIGSTIEFTESDFSFCHFDNNRADFIFFKITNDLSYFNALLAGFYTTSRPAYPDEVISVCGHPVWIEGPPRAADISWDKNVWGLPRHLRSGGSFMTPTLGTTVIPTINVRIKK